MQPKILLFDLETAPNLGWVWGKYEQDVIAYEKESYLLCFAAKWLGGKTFAHALPDYARYSQDPENDRKLVEDLWKLFDEADIIIAHNGDQFDIKKANARFLYHKLPPPSPYKTLDTKKIAKSVAMFNSNKLDDLGEHLGEGRKIKTDFSLWKGCMNGDPNSWKKMIRYNKQDVILLEKIYLRLRPFTKNHPNIGAYVGAMVCPRCGSTHLQSRGYSVSLHGRFNRFQCQTCGGWGRTNIKQSYKTHTAC